MRTLIFLALFVNSSVIANLNPNPKFKLEDFAIQLENITSDYSHMWVNSGYTTVNPEYLTVMGVNEFFSPPFAAKNFNLSINIKADSISIPDTGSFGKGDVGLLYAGGTWYPHKIVRQGTYHHLKNGHLFSFGVVSELIPLFGKSGFIKKVIITNRTSHPMSITLTPEIQPGIPSMIPLDKWIFPQPRPNASEIKKSSENIWATDLAKIVLYKENAETIILPGESSTSYFTVQISNSEEKLPNKIQVKELEAISIQAWEKRLETYTRNIPSIESNIEGLSDYYKRSILSGLVCIWENPDFTTNPFFSTAGMDGGGIVTYLWDNAGYIPQMATLMLDTAILGIAEKMVSIDLEKFHSFSPNGTGLGVRYSYSPWAFTTLVSAIFKFIGPKPELFSTAKDLILNNEQQQSENHLIDYGRQHNLLEMRGVGWEHFVASPNAERSWCLDQLAEMGKIINYNQEELNDWNKKANVITEAIQKELWDDRAKWFSSIYPNGFIDFVYSTQVYDVLRAGACTPKIEEDLVSHLRNGAFLGNYGVSSISKEDIIHYEVLDTDWSGGGAYTGDGPQISLILYEKGRSKLAWDVLKRHFWMGKHLIYYPQEHFIDKPMSPAHKRANISAGMAGAEAILFGLIGFQPQYTGELKINPQPVEHGEIKLKGFGFRNNKFDIELSKVKMKIIKNDLLFYEGEPKMINLL